MQAFTLQQALIPSFLQVPLILLLMIVATVIAVYITTTNRKIRNYWMGNRGIVTLMFILVLFFFGQGIEIPELVYAGINLLVALILFPLLLSGFIVTVALGPKGKKNICT